jgi:predicted XRE-type DNA-binding protein
MRPAASHDAHYNHMRTRCDQELKRLLAAELCAIVEGLDQYSAASMLRLHQPQVSALRHGRTTGFSIDRLLRLIVGRGYNVEVTLRPMAKRFGNPKPEPTLTVQRLDNHGHAVERPAAGPVKRVRRWSGEVDARAVKDAARRGVGRFSRLDSSFDMNDD